METHGRLGIDDGGGPGGPTAARLVAAARRAIAARGTDRLTMSAVAAEAGVSRPTLYRWFPTKALLLAAVTAEEVAEFDEGLRRATGSRRSSEARLDAAIGHLVEWLAPTSRAIGADPAFALQSLADSLPARVASLTGLLGDALDCVPAVRAGAMSRAQAAEVLLRLAQSYYLVPPGRAADMLGLLRAFAGLDRRSRLYTFQANV